METDDGRSLYSPAVFAHADVTTNEMNKLIWKIETADIFLSGFVEEKAFVHQLMAFPSLT